MNMMMESSARLQREDDQLILPPGFRFHPSDEELITHYLIKKVLDNNFSAKAIGEVDMNRIEPWELPGFAKMGKKEWYFFSVRDKKYPTGLRTNRATEAGYWKATGKDKEIFRGKTLVGMKKTLVFYKGRAPKGEKTNWVIHEYRLERKSSVQIATTVQIATKSAKNEWVISRVFHKNSGEKKPNSIGNGLPSLTESSTSSGGGSGVIKSDSSHLPCFSSPINFKASQNSFLHNSTSPYDPNTNVDYGFRANQSIPSIQDDSQLRIPLGYIFPVPGQSYFKSLPGNNVFQMEKDIIPGSQETVLSSEMNTEISSVMSNFEMGKKGYGDQEAPSTSVGQIDLDCFWSY